MKSLFMASFVPKVNPIPDHRMMKILVLSSIILK